MKGGKTSLVKFTWGTLGYVSQNTEQQENLYIYI